MNIFEAIGIGFVILMTCVGIYVCLRLGHEGLKGTVGRLKIGELYEDSAVRDLLGREQR